MNFANGDADSPPASGSDLRESIESWMQAIAPYGIFTTDAELRIRNWNQWLVAHSGLTAEKVVGRLLSEVFPDLKERRLLSRFTRALSGEISVLSTALHRYLLPLASTVESNDLPFMLQTARIAPLPSPQGIRGTITIIEDVTQREFQAAALRRQHEMDRLLSDALGALLQAADSAQDIAKIFTPLMPSFGLDAYFCYLWHPETHDFRMHAVSGIAPRQRENLAIAPLDSADKVGPKGYPETIPATLAAHLRQMDGLGMQTRSCWPLSIGYRVIGFMSFGSYAGGLVNVADHNLLSRVVHFLAIALDRSAKEREAQAASRAKDDFLAALSHELRTPLNPVLLVASDSANNPDYPASARLAFRTIERNALLEARLIDDLLDLTRIEHGKLRLELQPVDVDAAVRDALANVRADASDKDISLRVELEAVGNHIEGDPARLQQIFWNVLKNGIKFTPRGGQVSVASQLSPDDQTWVLEIRDTGIGMDARELGRIFNAFTQGDHAREKGGHQFGGLGLGLAICRRLVEMHGGHIEAMSEGKGKGSTFRISFKLLRSRTGDSRSPTAGDRETDPVESSPPVKPRRILLVEDHAPTRGPLVMLLNRRGYQVTAVGSAAEALDVAARTKFDLVLSDIGLPDMDGFALMRKLRDRHPTPGIALTGYGMESDVANSAAAGFVAHLTKPIHVDTLEKTLNAVFESSGVD